MQKLLYELYRFAGQNQLDRYLQHESEELEGDRKMCAYALEYLHDNLSPELWQWMDRYIYGRNNEASITSEAYFYSGLAMGLELARLTTG